MKTITSFLENKFLIKKNINQDSLSISIPSNGDVTNILKEGDYIYIEYGGQYGDNHTVFKVKSFEYKEKFKMTRVLSKMCCVINNGRFDKFYNGIPIECGNLLRYATKEEIDLLNKEAKKHNEQL